LHAKVLKKEEANNASSAELEKLMEERKQKLAEKNDTPHITIPALIPTQE